MTTEPVPGGAPRARHMSPDEFREAGRRVVEWIASYMERVESLPVLSRVGPGEVSRSLPERPPERGEPWDDILADVERIVLPGLTHWQSPGFFAYFPANASGPAILGDLLSSGLGVQGMLWSTSPACTEIEIRMLDWLAELLGLPERFTSRSSNGGGVIQGTASEATLVAMVAARARAHRRAGGAAGELTAYASTQAHSSVLKAAMISGVGREALRLVETDGSLAMNPDALARAIRGDEAAGRRPFFVCATVGTTSSTAVDPVRAVARACGASGAWLHVDAAYAGALCVCPEHRWMIDGVALADSFNFNPHKALLTNFDCSALWTADASALVDALSVTPEYLRNAASDSGAVVDFRDWQIPLGRRFRALKLWFVMRHYGAEGLRAHVREHVRLAALFESLVRADERFETAAPRMAGLVCFRLRAGDDAGRALMERANATGKIYLTHTALPEPAPAGPPRFTLRLAVGATTAAESHVREAWELISSLA